MIAPLRRRHRWMVLSLAVALPPAVAATLASRPAPVRDGDSLFTATSSEPATVVSLGGGLTLELRPAGPAAILARLDSSTERPALLIYWSAAMPVGEVLPADAHLLGPVSADHPVELPRPPAGGALLLFSVVDGTLVGATPQATPAGP